MDKKFTKIGIPRAISYYNNYPFYYGFFTSLGIEIILSDKTTTKTINEGTKYVVSDTCLPIKVFTGHVINLINKGCEAIFIPSIQSTGYKINNCSKIRGLPEIIRNVIDKPFTMIEPTLDKTENINFKDFCTQTANALGITDKQEIKKAINNGWKVYNSFIEMTKSGVSYTEALENAINGKFIKKTVDIVKPLSVAIMAHGYNLFDDRISLNLIKKLEKMDVKVYTSVNVSREDLNLLTMDYQFTMVMDVLCIAKILNIDLAKYAGQNNVNFYRAFISDINEILKEKGKSKYWLYIQLGLSYQNFNKIVNNQTEGIKFKNLKAICDILEVTPNDLFAEYYTRSK